MDKELVDAFLKVYGDDLISLVLFGSYARGEQRRDSDIDLLVVLKEIKNRYEVMRKFLLAEDILENTLYPRLREKGFEPYISPIIYDVQTATRFRPLYIMMVFEARILYDREGVMTKTLEKIRRRLEELGAKREKFGRGYVVTLTKVKPGEVVNFE
ncbi:nucleotidyltransferase domain-containing protein [Saccharolobus islandicus]|uniref:DNA polymerase beta domain protein region n=3 Tax=Saccharolobus islandicus TaxID=43080 RepID=C4KDZ8_SACI6|nr:nucleotidyltransferase domain-containing protein [Sulfolobus islandicus]ACP37316.1 DNA polymerase beta domain protein region [Sulfolobus islandicus M.14.25]ACP54473.1 DNA polymerase beta domain protein region [Sulfolobus islandicus M.16.27]ACR41121.1 DNA polymerase beta domain protein region [Sulfolobus islandicus M.16.4]